MAGRGPAPKTVRRRRNVPVRGEAQTAKVVGWQHGPIPDPPDGLMAASLEAWDVWFAAWFAAHWSPDDVPQLRHLVRLYDEVERGGPTSARAELRLEMETYGITPKGQQDRRWVRMKTEERTPSQSQQPADHYAHLKVVPDD